MSLLTMQLRSASFRGVSFAVDSATYNAGRRTALHEYPKRDTPYVEDMGRATRTYALKAFIVGTDYIVRTKRLMAALEKSGAGRLVHPWLGELNVVATEVGKASFDTKLGQATIELTFVEAGENLYPSTGANELTQLRTQIDSVLEKVSEAFDKAISIAGHADFVASAVATTWGEIVGICAQTQTFISTTFSEALTAVDILKASTDPTEFVADVIDAMGFYKLADDVRDWHGYAHDLTQTAGNSAFNTESTDGLVAESSDKVIIENANALKQMLQTVLLVQAAGCASFVGTDADSASLGSADNTTSYDSMIGVRNKLCDALDAQVLATEDDELAIELDLLRSRVHETLTERAEQEARIVTMNFPAGLPVLVAAYQKYGDAERCDEIVRLNSVAHPGFSPEGGLKVLSE